MGEVKSKPVTIFVEETVYAVVKHAERNLSAYLRRLIYRDLESRGLMSESELRKVLQ